MGDDAQHLLDRVRATIGKYHMLAAGESVLAAVSGGPDSMCLLHALIELGYRIQVAHFDHQTRGLGSAGDARFARDAAMGLGLRFHLECRPIVREAKEARASFEDFARRARYAFFRSVADSAGCTAIATGHHADDRAETVLMRLLRGTWPGGLGAIPPVREHGEGRRVVRPLIECTRAGVLGFLGERNIAYRIDESNESAQFTRNRVRHNLLPLLATDYNPRIRDALCRLAEMQHDASEAVHARTDELFQACFVDDTIDLIEFARGPVACQRELLAGIAESNGIEVDYERIERARRFILEGPQHRYLDFGNGAMLRNERGTTYIVPGGAQGSVDEVELRVPGATPALGKVFHCHGLDAPPAIPLREFCTATRQVFDAERMAGRLTVRTRRDGDRCVPLGLGFSRKLQDLFVDKKVDQPLRDAVPLICVDGHIAWVAGHAIDESVSITESTTAYLLIEVEDALE